MKLHTEYFYGNKVSEEGIKYGYLDYGTLAKAFNHVMDNGLMERTDGVIGYWEPISGDLEDEDGNYIDVFQWFIVDDQGAEILKEAGEILYENEELGLTLWGVTHWGTAWDYVLTDIKINQPYDD